MRPSLPSCIVCGLDIIFEDAKPADREDLFIKKIRQCANVYDFTDPLSELKVGVEL